MTGVAVRNEKSHATGFVFPSGDMALWFMSALTWRLFLLYAQYDQRIGLEVVAERAGESAKDGLNVSPSNIY